MIYVVQLLLSSASLGRLLSLELGLTVTPTGLN